MKRYLSRIASGLVLTSLSSLALTGCVTTVSNSPAGANDVVARVGQATQAWEVTVGGEAVGTLVRFGSRQQDLLFLVRDSHGQDLGMIDSLGRVWRLTPPSGEPECIGSGTVSEGVGRILGTGPGLVLRETETPDESR